jgi:hypothetical protein
VCEAVLGSGGGTLLVAAPHLKLRIRNISIALLGQSLPITNSVANGVRYVAAIQHTVEAAQVNKPARQTASRAHWKMLRREDLRNRGYDAESIRQGLRDRRTIRFLAKRNTEHSPVSFSLLPTMTGRLGMF